MTQPRPSPLGVSKAWPFESTPEVQVVASQAVSWAFWARPVSHLYSAREGFQVLRRLLILSRAEAPDEPVQGGEYHASPSVGLQAPLVVLLVVSSLPEDSGTAEDEEAGGESTGEACTTAGVDWVVEAAEEVMIGEAAVVTGAVRC